jgi:uncharacterized membrane protein YgcG
VIVRTLKIALRAVLLLAVAAGAGVQVAQAQSGFFPTPAEIAQQTSAGLEQLVAPIALYPDELVAEVLAASTYPTEVVEAASWIRQRPTLTGTPLADAVDSQSWDPSVKALTQFPSVLYNMEQNLSWISALGSAYTSQPGAVMDAVQLLRQRAQAAGTLASTSQQSVTTQGQDIVIQPADPATVYVPAYDPWFAYGAPLDAYPGWVDVPDVYYGGPGLYFGAGFGIGLFAGYGFGYHHWNPDWRHHDVDYDHHHWESRSPTFSPPRAPFHSPGPVIRGGAPNFARAPGPFSGFDHGGIAHGFAGRGNSSLGGAGGHGGGFARAGGGGGGGFHGGGGGGSHGGGGHH